MNSPQSPSLSAPTESASADLLPCVENPPTWLSNAMAVPREEGKVDVDGCPIHYYRWGASSKPGIILLHGFLAHSRCFAFIAPFLAEHYHVVAMDMSGMGDSGWRDEYDEATRVKELITVAEKNHLFDHAHKPTIIAHSYGGRIGTAAMDDHAERFAGLIICDLMIIRPSILKANADKFGPPGKREPGRPNKVYPDYATAKSRFVLSPPQPVENPELLDFMAYHSLKQVDGGWQWKFDPKVFKLPEGAEHRWSEVGKNLVNAPGRKAIIHGQDSLLFTEDSAHYIDELVAEYDAIPIPVIAIPYARHHLMLDQPIAFVSTLRSVLAMWK